MKNSKASSGGLKTFFLYNVEKLILGASLILLALFFYLGLSSEKFEKSPDNLIQEANQAASYIDRTSNWDEIKAFRKGDVAVIDRVKRASKPVDGSNFQIPGLSMVPKPLQLRLDPPLPKIQDVEAHVIRAAVIVKNKKKNFDDPILRLPLAMVKEDPNAKKSMSMMEMEMMGPSQDELDDMKEMGGPGGSSTRDKMKMEKNPQLEAEVDAWWGMPGVQEATQHGVRPRTVASAGSDMALTRNVVVVNGLVNHKNLWKLHEKTLSSSLGYYPKRDLPRYDYLQVERREIKNGQPGEWRDISTFVNFDQAELYPNNFSSAPEVVPPENYDQFLTNAIPPILGFDYANYVVHSQLNKRVFKVPEKKDEGVATSDILAGKEKLNSQEEMMLNPDGTGIRRQKKGLSGSGTFGNMGEMGGMVGADVMASDMMDFGMRTGDGRSSSDLTEYAELSDITIEPVSDYKQIRFFDMSVTPQSPATYEYRMRIWVADPNNADEKSISSMNDFGQGDMDEMMMGAGPMGRAKGEEKKFYKKTKINFTMQDQKVRDRLKRAREVGPLGAKEYYVTEVYEGSDVPVETKVPTGEEYLRFARPTQWSETIKVSFGTAGADFFANKIEEPRKVRVGSTEIPVDEPKAEIVTAVEDSNFQGTRLAAKRLFAVGDLLNFSEPVTIMHPVAQSIHFLDQANLRSNGVLIDVMGGQRLDLPRNEPLEYELPGETLIMEQDGDFIISNDIEDLEKVRHALRLPDERAEYGGKKAARRAEEEAMEKMRENGFPGGSGTKRGRRR